MRLSGLSDFNRIDGNHVAPNDGRGISLQGANHIAVRNTVSNNTISGITWAMGVGNGIGGYDGEYDIGTPWSNLDH